MMVIIEKMFKEIGVYDVFMIYVFNKVDLIEVDYLN